MAYAQLDEHFDEHPKYEDLDLDHYGLMACALSYCNRLLTDGFVTEKAVRGFGRRGKGLRIAEKLVEKGIWTRTSGGFQVVGFLDHNPSRAQVLAKREAARTRKESYRRGQAARSPEELPTDAGNVPPGQSRSVNTGQAVSETRLSQSPRARAPAGAIHSTPLHCTDPPNPQPPSGQAPPPSTLSPPSVGDGFQIPRHVASDQRAEWVAAYERGVRSVEPGFAFDQRTFEPLFRVVGRRLPAAYRPRIAEWIEREAGRFALAVAAKPAVWSAFSPSGFERWWNCRCPTEGDPSGSAALPKKEKRSPIHVELDD